MLCAGASRDEEGEGEDLEDAGDGRLMEEFGGKGGKDEDDGGDGKGEQEIDPEETGECPLIQLRALDDSGRNAQVIESGGEIDEQSSHSHYAIGGGREEMGKDGSGKEGEALLSKARDTFPGETAYGLTGKAAAGTQCTSYYKP